MECITEVENSSMTFALTDSDKKQLRSNYDVMVFSHDCKPETIDKKKVPSNAVLVTYEINGVVKHDHVVGPKNVKVFDAYYDLLKTVGGKILTMETMYGMINPKLWNDPTTKKSPTKKKK